MAKWEELPLADRAAYMKVAVKNGYRDIRTIKEAYNEFAKGGKKETKKDDYNTWLESEAKVNSERWGIPYNDALSEMKNDRTYNYKKFFEAQQANPSDPRYIRDAQGNYHYNDIGKSVYHPTASIESYYSGKTDPVYNPTGAKFGRWSNNGHEYRMSDDMLRAGANPYTTIDYLTNNEDNGVFLKDERGNMFKDWRYPEETYIGGVLPNIDIYSRPLTIPNTYQKGGRKTTKKSPKKQSSVKEKVLKIGDKIAAGMETPLNWLDNGLTVIQIGTDGIPVVSTVVDLLNTGVNGWQAVGHAYQGYRATDPEQKRTYYEKAALDGASMGLNFVPGAKPAYKIGKAAAQAVIKGAGNAIDNRNNAAHTNNPPAGFDGTFHPFAWGGDLLNSVKSLFTPVEPPRKVVFKGKSGRVFNTRKEVQQDNYNYNHKRGDYAPTYDKVKVKKGDTLYGIAKSNNIDLNTIYKYNPQYKNNSTIFPGDEIAVKEKPSIYKQQKNANKLSLHNVKDQWKLDALNNQDNLKAIQSVIHNDNYVVIDKKNGVLSVYDTNNNLLYKSTGISTGISGNDYNTITYLDTDGTAKNNAGNNSTPAGITQITSKGTYHNLPSFTRGRMSKNGYEDIASSIHFGNTEGTKLSNGCVRLDKATLENLSKYINVGTNVYTLPEKAGSRFVARDGKLSYIADNPYGSNEGLHRYWDDYNVTENKDYSPLIIKPAKNYKSGSGEYTANVTKFSGSLSKNKRNIMKQFGLDSDTYNHLANLALGIAEQETKFGTSLKYYAKLADANLLDSAVSNLVRGNKNRSRGLTQIKLAGDAKPMQTVYKNLGITEDNITDAETSALATVARLAYMYKNEVEGRTFVGQGGKNVDQYDALLYKWMGSPKQLSQHTATPESNIYIRNVKNYSDNFDLYSYRY